MLQLFDPVKSNKEKDSILILLKMIIIILLQNKIQHLNQYMVLNRNPHKVRIP